MRSSYRCRIVRPFPYTHRERGPVVAPVGAYEVAEVGEHLQFAGEGLEPFSMDKNHALEHLKTGHLTIEDWQS
jgi:hypothetical protein